MPNKYFFTLFAFKGFYHDRIITHRDIIVKGKTVFYKYDALSRMIWSSGLGSLKQMTIGNMKTIPQAGKTLKYDWAGRPRGPMTS